MSIAKDKIDGFLKNMGFAAELALASGEGSSLWQVPGGVTHNGVLMTVALDAQTQSLFVQVGFGFVPKANIAPLLRRLLALNVTLIEGTFCLNEATNMLVLQLSRRAEHLEFADFKAILDGMAAKHFQVTVPLVQEFQIPQTAS